LISWSRHKKLAELEAALAMGPQVEVNVRDAAGNTPLIVACQNGHAAVAQLLVRHHADVRCANKKGNTALHFCFAYGFEELGEYLILQGADEYAQNAEGLTCYEGLTRSDLDKL
jgi:ankyrin repeat protein